MANNEEELLDYEDEEAVQPDTQAAKATDGVKKGYVGIHAAGFKDFQLKPELLRAITDCGFEHPSEVQHECIPQALVGTDVLCQAKSGMGKTAVFVLSVLHQLEAKDGEVQCLVLGHTRELALQICKEFERFKKHIPGVRVAAIVGGMPEKEQVELLKDASKCPHIVVGTPGRLKKLASDGTLKLANCRHFILDECDKMLSNADMRADVQTIFFKTPHDKQVMMYSATMPKEIRPICKKFMSHPHEIFVDDESKLTLHGLVQHYVLLNEDEKNQKLFDILDEVDFNQVVIFVSPTKNHNGNARAKSLHKLLKDGNFPALCITGNMPQEQRNKVYNEFKKGSSRVLVCTDLIGRGIDIERVNVVINYDMPCEVERGADRKGTGTGVPANETEEAKTLRHGKSADQYLHRVGRAGRFGTKGLAISFVASMDDSEILNKVQERFDVDIKELEGKPEPESYRN